MNREIEKHFQRNFLELDALLTPKNIVSGNLLENATHCLTNLSRIVSKCFCRSRETNELATSFLFHSENPPNLVLFLRKSCAPEFISVKDVVSIRIQVLDFITDLFKQYRNELSIFSHIQELHSICMHVYRIDKSNKAKNSAVKVLLKILKYWGGVIAEGDLDISNMMEWLIKELRFGKAAQTVKGLSLQLLGSIAKHFPKAFSIHKNIVFLWMENTLEKQFKSPSPEFSLVTGLFSCLNELLSQYQEYYELNPDAKTKKTKLFSNIMVILKVTVAGALSRFAVTKVCLGLLTNHSVLFHDNICSEGFDLYQRILFCITSANKTVRKNAFPAVNSFFNELTSSSMPKKDFNRFIKCFLPHLSQESAVTFSELDVSIKGLGYFAPAITEHLGIQSLLKIMNKLGDYGEQLAANDDIKQKHSKTRHLATFLWAQAKFTEQVPADIFEYSSVNIFISSIETLMESYPLCGIQTKRSITDAVAATFLALHKKRGALSDLLSKVIYRGLLLTFSNQMEGNDKSVLYNPDTGLPETKLLYEFEGMWVNLLESHQNRCDVQVRVYNEVVKSTLSIIQQLNLTYHTCETTGNDTDCNNELQPVVPRDHTIFLNIVEFCRRLYLTQCTSLFLPWIGEFSQFVIMRSNELPLVSGFYHLARLILEICAEHEYFSGFSIFTVPMETGVSKCSDTDATAAKGKEKEFLSFVIFLKSVVTRMKFYQDELLFACIHFSLSVPHPFVDLSLLCPVLSIALKTGVSYLPAADVSITAMETWLNICPEELLANIPAVLPLLNAFLHHSESPTKNESDDSSTLSQIQRRFLIFLGRIGSRVNRHVLKSSSSTFESHLISWSRTPEFQLGISVSNCNSLVLQLDILLPRVCDLAQHQVQRQAKVAACELLHALVLYLCGKTATHPQQHDATHHPYLSIWKRVFPVCLCLAIDHERITVSLFDPLVGQIVRWFSGGGKYFQQEANLCLEALINGIVSSSIEENDSNNNCSLHEFCANQFADFLKYSLKQQRQNINKNPLILMLFDKITALCHHPGKSQRYAAALLVNSIYRIFREDTALVAIYTLGLMQSLLYALRLSHPHPPHLSLLNVNQTSITVERVESTICMAISHLQKIVLRSGGEIFSRSDCEHTSCSSLHEFVEWLFQNVSAKETRFRSAVQDLFLVLSRVVDNCGSSRAWIATKTKRPISGACLFPSEAPIFSSAKDIDIIKWLESVLSSLDGAIFLCQPRFNGKGIVDFRSLVYNDESRKRKRSTLNDEDFEFPIFQAVLTILCYFNDIEHRIQGLSNVVLDKCCSFVLMVLEIKEHQQDLTCYIKSEIDSIIQKGLLIWLADYALSCSTLTSHGHVSKLIMKLVELEEDAFLNEISKLLNTKYSPTRLNIGDPAYADSLIAYQNLLELGLYDKKQLEFQQSNIAKYLAENACNAIAPKELSTKSISSPNIKKLANRSITIALTFGWSIIDSLLSSDGEVLYSEFAVEIESIFLRSQFHSSTIAKLIPHLATKPYLSRMMVSLLTKAEGFLLVHKSTKINGILEAFLLQLDVLLKHLNAFDQSSQSKHGVMQILTKFVGLVPKLKKQEQNNLLKHGLLRIKLLLCDLLVGNRTSASLKGDILILLSFFVEDSIDNQNAFCIDDDISTRVIDGVQHMLINDFPIHSYDVQVNTANYEEFRFLFTHLLTLVANSSSFALFKKLLPSFQEKQKHIFADEIESFIQQFTTKLIAIFNVEGSDSNIYDDHQKDCKMEFLVAFLAYILDEDSSLDHELRVRFTSQIFLPLLWHLPVTTLANFTTRIYPKGSVPLIRWLMVLIQKDNSVNQSPSSYTSHGIAFSLLEVIYLCIPSDTVRGQINNCYLGHSNGKGRELTMALCKTCSKTCTLAMEVRSNEFYFCSSQAFNCLIAAVSQTQTQEKFFDKIIFQDNIWANIVSIQEDELEFEVETPIFESYKSRSGLIVPSDRTTYREQGSKASSIGYQQESQFLYGSSLSQDAMYFDLQKNDCTTDKDTGPTQKTDQSIDNKTYKKKIPSSGHGGLELDRINQERCMVPLLDLLEQMNTQFGSSWSNSAMPGWMKKVFDIFTNSSFTSIPVRLFICKIILNRPDWFQAYASAWTNEIMRFFLDLRPHLAPPDGFHYLLRDFLHIVLEVFPKTGFNSNQCSNFNAFLNYLVTLVPHSRSVIFKENLCLVKNLLQFCISLSLNICIDISVVSTFLGGIENPTKERIMTVLAGLHLLGLSLSELKMKLFDQTDPDILKLLRSRLFLCLHSSSKQVYTLSAEICGMLLIHGSNCELTPSDTELKDKLASVLLELFKEEKTEAFLRIIRNACMHSSAFLKDNSLLSRIFSILSTVIAVDAWSSLTLEIFLQAMTSMPNLITQIFLRLRPFFPNLLGHRNSQTQLLALQVVQYAVKFAFAPKSNFVCDSDIELINPEHIMSFLKSDEDRYCLLPIFQDHEDESCRLVLNDILVFAYESHEPIRLAMRQGSLSEMHCCLLQGLCDSSTQIQEKITQFWEKEQHFLMEQFDFHKHLQENNLQSIKRLINVFYGLYHPNRASKWVRSASLFMLSSVLESCDQSYIFEAPLSDCVFQNLDIDASLQLQSQSMAPLFSFDSQRINDDRLRVSSQSEEGVENDGFLKATQDLKWSQTQFSSQGMSVAHQSMDLDNESDIKDKLKKQHRSTKKRFYRFTRPSSSKLENDTHRSFFVKQAMLTAKRKQAEVTRQHKARHQRVRLYRRYRKGELPDILITRQEILNPLMGLCKIDPTICIDLMVQLFTTIYGSFVSSSTSSSVLSVVDDVLVKQLEHILQTSRECHSVVLFLFRICLSDVNQKAQSFLKLNPRLICQAALASKNFHTGQLLLETCLLNASKEDTNMPHQYKEEIWNQLSYLFYALKDNMMILAISSQMSQVPKTHDALRAQLMGDISTACNLYKEAKRVAKQQRHLLSITGIEKERWVSGRTECLYQLNKWDRLHEEILDLKKEDMSITLWKNKSPILENKLKYVMKSCINMNLEADSQIQPEMYKQPLEQLGEFLTESKSSQVKWNVLETNFLFELALFHCQRHDFNQAKAHIEQFYRLFLTKWTNFHPLARDSRLVELQILPFMVQLDDLLQTRVVSIQIKPQHVADLLQKWEYIVPSLTEDSVEVWGNYYTANCACFLDINQSLQMNLSEIIQKRLNVVLNYAKAAVSQGNLSLASRYLKEYRTVCNDNNLPKISLLMVDVFVSHVTKLAARQLEKFLSTSSKLTIQQIEQVRTYHETALKMFDNQEVVSLISQLPQHEQLEINCFYSQILDQSSEFYANYGQNQDLAGTLAQSAYTKLENSCMLIEELPNDKSKTITGRKLILSFSLYLNKLILSAPQSTNLVHSSLEEMANIFTVNVLRGIALGEPELISLFPRVLEMLELFPSSVAKTFIATVPVVPLWQLLPWVAQMVALLNKPAYGDVILTLLEQMAEIYPKYLYYDFKISFDQLDNPDGKLSRLTALLSNSTLDMFVDALHGLHHPELRLKQGLREVSELVEKNEMRDAKLRMVEIWQDCFSEETLRLGGLIGKYNRSFAKRMKKEYEKILGKSANGKLIKANLDKARLFLLENFQMAPGKYGVDKKMHAPLANFSEWLDEFDRAKYDIFMPGQNILTGQKPDIGEEVKVVSTAPTLLVLASKQLPKRITFHGSDEKDYNFLVKGGEDLRLDQRIEKLFEVMNRILLASPMCKSSGLHNKTYKVIPMTRNVGLIEWLDDTSTLKRTVELEMDKINRCKIKQGLKVPKGPCSLLQLSAAKEYDQFLSKYNGKSYTAKVAGIPVNELQKKFAHIVDLTPSGLIRNSLLEMSNGAEAFFQLRESFLKSLATLNSCGYILGIGDRHLDNFLLDKKDGTLIGIDFGVSFGAGASILPVPELVPFRLSNQFSSVCQPHDTSYLLQQHMFTVFSSLREKKQQILSVMNIFINEPLLDWQKPALYSQKRGYRSDVAIESDKQITSLAHCKIEMARRKLEGYHPSGILIEELEQNVHLQKRVLNSFKDVAIGDQSRKRHKLWQENPDRFLPIIDQVECLIDLAVDPNVLGRTFIGWSPWV